MKKFLIVLTLLLAPFVVIADDLLSKDAIYTIDNFSDMEKSHVSPYLLKDGAATQATNVRANEEYGSLAKRPKRLTLASCHASPVRSLSRYYRSDDTKFTVDTSGIYMDSVDSNGICTTLYGSATDGKRWSFITYKDMHIGTNGYDNVKKWDGSLLATSNTDGHRTASDLITDLGAPFAELNTGSNLTASKWYQYKVAFFDTDTGIYTYSNARSNPLLTGATVRDIRLTDIPLGPSGVDHRVIYRTTGDVSRAAVVVDTNLYRVTTITDNTTTTYNDTMSDATLVGASSPTWATVSAGVEVTPPRGRFTVINQERLFMANDPNETDSGKSSVYWSDVLNPDYFYPTDYELIRPDDGDQITFMKNLLGTLTIGKNRTINKFYTSGSSSGWTISDPYSFTGCVSPYSAVNSVTGIIYLGRYGIYTFNGQSSELISDAVTDKIRDILETSQESVVGIYSDNAYHMAYTSASSGASANNRVLVFDLVRDAYVEDTSAVDSFTTYDSGDDYGILYSGSSGVDGTIYAHGESFSRVIYRYKSQFEDGSIYRTYVGGEENDPTLTLGSSEAWAESGSSTWAGSGSATWLFDYQAGTWTSPIIQVNADNLDKLYWNENLGSTGNITWAISTGASAGSMSAFSSEVSDPSGSDVSGVSANTYIQLRASLSDTSWTSSPALYLSDNFVAKLTYQKSGSAAEPSYLSLWQGKETTLGSESQKRIKEIQVIYEGTSGTLTLYADQNEGRQYSFSIDLSVDPTSSTQDSYFGTNDEKVYVYTPSYDNQPVGRIWQFTASETGVESWKIKKIIVRYDVLPYVTYQRTL